MNRLCISFFGCTNAGKSSLVNALTAQQVSVVSEIAGTTTDPVFKMMEFLPLGPVAVYDTPGIDDESVLGKNYIPLLGTSAGGNYENPNTMVSLNGKVFDEACVFVLIHNSFQSSNE